MTYTHTRLAQMSIMKQKDPSYLSGTLIESADFKRAT